MEIGKGKYGKDASQQKKNFKLQDGSNVYRILPPCGSQVESGRVAVYYRIHWGYFILDETGNKRMRPFMCIQRKNFKSGLIEQKCPECEETAKVTALRDEKINKKVAELLAAGKFKTKEEAEKSEDVSVFVAPLTEWLKSHNSDGKFYLNVKNDKGEIGKLAIPSKSKQSLFLKIEELRAEDAEFDPCGIDTGAWFDFRRTPGASFRDTVHEVHVVKEKIKENGRTAEYRKEAPLTKEDLERMSKEAWDLGDLYRVLPVEQIQKLVSCSGDPDVVKAIFGSAEKAPRNSDGSEKREASPPAQPAAKATVETKAVPVKVEAPAVDDEEAALAAQLAAIRAKKAAAELVKAVAKAEKATPPETAKAAASASPSDLGDMSDDEFLANFSTGKI